MRSGLGVTAKRPTRRARCLGSNPVRASLSDSAALSAEVSGSAMEAKRGIN